MVWVSVSPWAQQSRSQRPIAVQDPATLLFRHQAPGLVSLLFKSGGVSIVGSSRSAMNSPRPDSLLWPPTSTTVNLQDIPKWTVPVNSWLRCRWTALLTT